MLSHLYLLKLLGFYLIFVTYFYLTGKIILSFFNTQSISSIKIFSTFFIGILFNTITFSLIKSGFMTIHIVLIPLISIFLFINRSYFKKFLFDKTNIKKELILLSLIALSLFIYQLYFYVDFFSLHIKSLFVDNYTYASISSNLKTFGSENIDFTLNTFFQSYENELIPYRYSDLWLAAFIMQFADISDIESFYLFSTSILISLIAVFIFELFNQSIHIWKRYLLTVLLLFVSVSFIPYLNDDFKYTCETSLMGTFQQKLAFASSCFCLSIFFWDKHRKSAILFLIATPIFYVAYLPSMWGGVCLYLCILIIRNRREIQLSKQYLFLLISTFAIVLCYFLFYKINAKYYLSYTNVKFLEIPIIKQLPKELIDSNTPFNFKSFVSNFIFYTIPKTSLYLYGSIGHLIIGSLFYFPMILIFYNELKIRKSFILLIVICLFSGLIFTVLKDGDCNNYQFFTNQLIIFSLLITTVFIKKTNEKSFLNWKSITFCLVTFCFCFLPIIKMKNYVSKEKMDVKFYTSVSKILKKNTSSIIICFVGDDIFKQGFYDWVGQNNLNKIKQYQINPVTFTIGNPEKILEKSPPLVLDYTYNWTPLNIWRSKKKNIKEFIINKNIKYLYYNSNVSIPKYILKQTKIKLTDNLGNVFLVIK